MNPRIILSQTYSPTLKFLLRSFFFFFFLLSNISSRHRRNYCNFIFLPKFGRCTYTILGQFYNQLKRSSVYNIYMDMSPLAVSLFQIHFQISNNQTITVFPALEVAPVQKQCVYQKKRIKSNGQIIISTKKKKVAINYMAMLSRCMQHISQNS